VLTVAGNINRCSVGVGQDRDPATLEKRGQNCSFGIGKTSGARMLRSKRNFHATLWL
jgi:hypothetical protein